MLDRVNRALMVFGSLLPGAIREIIKDLAKEIDLLRQEMDETRAKIKQLEREQNASMGNGKSEG